MKAKVLFVCLGNICRSPTAEGVFKNLIESKGLSDQVIIDSAGTNGYHNGELPDPRMHKHGAQRGYDFNSISRQVTENDFVNFDYIIAMDDSNVRNLKQFCPDSELFIKVRKMTDFGIELNYNEVPDPYYGGAAGFELVIDIIEDASNGLLKFLESEK